MTQTIQDELHAFAAALLERRGGLVDWPDAGEEGTALLPPELVPLLRADDETIRLSCQPGGDGLCVSLATDFLEDAAGLLAAEPRIGRFRIRELYLKRSKMEDAVDRTFGWHNVKVKFLETRATRLEYHTWWFHASVVSEDRWESRFCVTINSSSGVEVEIPDPLELWELQPLPGARDSTPSTGDAAFALAQTRMKALIGDFVARMDSRLDRDRKRLRGYYSALFKETANKKARGAAKPDPEKIEAKKRAVRLELRRKLSELDERYAMEAILSPIVLIRTEIPVLAIDLLMFRKQAQRKHTVYWNPLLKELEPLCCSRCGKGTFSVAFTNEEVASLCPACAERK